MTVKELRAALKGAPSNALVFVIDEYKNEIEVVNVITPQPRTAIERKLDSEETVYLELD